MEEILASIRRIISEDDAPEDGAAAAAAPAPEPEPEAADFDAAPAAKEEIDEDVLELTETYEAPKSVSIGDIDAFEAEPEPAPAPKPIPKPKAAAVEGGLVSPRTEASAASAFGNLTGALLVPQSDRTLEDVTRDLLRPLLQAWLDENLPGIVEEQVRAEVERIARQSRR
jgi:cell pole-organizing protein PopZ